MNRAKAIRTADLFNSLSAQNPYVRYDVQGDSPDARVRQINTCRKTGEERYGVAAY